MRVFKVTRPGFGTIFCIYVDAANLADGELTDTEVGDEIKIEVVDMSREEVDGKRGGCDAGRG